MSTKFKWLTYHGSVLVPDPANYQVPEQVEGAILFASCYSRNGYYGCAWVLKWDGSYYIQAGSEDTGNLWRSPDTAFNTIGEAVAEAERLWRAI